MTLTLNLYQPPSLSFSPKGDITAYELALCLPIILRADMSHAANLFYQLPDYAKRHWVLSERDADRLPEVIYDELLNQDPKDAR